MIHSRSSTRGWSANHLQVHRVAERSTAENAVALEVRQLVREHNARGSRLVLGLATGNSVLGVYAELVRLQALEPLDWSGVRTYNLDEYCGLELDHPASFHSFMRLHLFGPLGLSAEVTRFPATTGSSADLERALVRYEEQICEDGGIDYQLLGLGRNGHIAFNEPGSARHSRTRVVELHETTREDAAATFGGIADVPKTAATMGLATILEARHLCVLAFGERKAASVKHLLQEAQSAAWPATYLREHAQVDLWLDKGAACLLAPH